MSTSPTKHRVGVKRILSLLFVVAMSLAFTSALHAQSGASQVTQALGAAEIENLVRASIVRVGQHVTGEATIQPFTLNTDTGEIIADSSKAELTVPLDLYQLGSGVFVSKNGHILTNAHIVSEMHAKLRVALPLITEVVTSLPTEEGAGEGGGEEVSTEYIADLSTRILEHVLENATFKLRREVVVIDPSSATQSDDVSSFAEAFEVGLPAQVLFVEDDYYLTNNDLAIIKIEGSNYPSLIFSDAPHMSEERDVYAFDLTVVDDFAEEDLYNSEIVPGTITLSVDPETNLPGTDITLQRTSGGGPIVSDVGTLLGIAAVGLSSGSTVDDTQGPTHIIPIRRIEVHKERFSIGSEEGSQITIMRELLAAHAKGECDRVRQQATVLMASINPFTRGIDVERYLTSCVAVETDQPATLAGSVTDIVLAIGSSDSLSTVLGILVVVLVLVVLGLFLWIARRASRRHDRGNEHKDYDQILEQHIDRIKQSGQESVRTMTTDIATSSFDGTQDNHVTDTLSTPHVKDSQTNDLRAQTANKGLEGVKPPQNLQKPHIVTPAVEIAQAVPKPTVGTMERTRIEDVGLQKTNSTKPSPRKSTLTTRETQKSIQPQSAIPAASPEKIAVDTPQDLGQRLPQEEIQKLAGLWPSKYRQEAKSAESSGGTNEPQVINNVADVAMNQSARLRASESAAPTFAVKERTETKQLDVDATTSPIKGRLPNATLVEYISSTRALGFSDRDIRTELEKTGWHADDIDLAFSNI